MSVLGDVGKFFTGIGRDIAAVASAAWNGLKAAWSFLRHVGGILNGAWDWMVNGVTWFSSQISDWAAAVFTLAWHTLTNVIPGAVTWIFRQATKWAATAINAVEGVLRGLIKNVITWAGRELNKLANTARGWFTGLVKFVTGPINWVLKTGTKIASLVLHPEALVKWILGALIVPLILWVLRSSANVIVWLVRSMVQRDSEIAHVIEDVLAKVI